MEHLLLKAAVTAATEEGLFTAVISAASIDREKDIVDPAGMVRALQKWVPTGKKVPLAWNHSTAPEHQIGYINPATARVNERGEVVADGWIDQSTPSGEHAWRQVKAGTLGFSFGYLTLASSPRKGGGRLLKELDVFEVTATPTPMNNDTRVLGWKAAADVEEQEADTLEVVLELLGDFLDTEDDAQDIATARDIIARVQTLLTTENMEPPDGKAVAPDLSKTVTPAIPDIDEQAPVDGTAQAPGRAVDPLREKAQALALEIASGGMSLEQSPTPAQKAPPVLMPLDELRERTRVEMLTVLSGMDIEQ